MAGARGRSGRKPKPIAALKLTGTYREDRHGGSVQAPLAGKLRCPSWLDEYGQKHFRSTVKALSAVSGLLASVDLDAIAVYASAWSDFRKAQDVLDQDPRNGAARRRKYRAIGVIHQTMTRFGMSPCDRAGLRLPETEDPKMDWFEQALRNRASN